MQMRPMNGCPIWPGSPANVQALDTDGRLRVESGRAGGEYQISVSARDLIESWDDGARARLTTWLVDQRLLGIRSPKVTRETIEYAKNKRPLSVHERAERLLKFIGYQMETVGASYKIWRYEIDVRAAFCAWSESMEWDTEVNFLLTYLFEQKWLQGVPALWLVTGRLQSKYPT